MTENKKPRRGRRTREEKYEHLKEQLAKKELQRSAIDEEIKEIKGEIEELEQFFLMRKTKKLQAALSKKGLTLEQLAEAVTKGEIELKMPEGDS